jgi:hypothetical protein
VRLIWKRLIRSRKPEKDRKHNDQGQRDLQNITQKTKIRPTRTPLKTGGELRCSRRVGSSCSTWGTRRVALLANLVISLECGKDPIVITTNGRVGRWQCSWFSGFEKSKKFDFYTNVYINEFQRNRNFSLSFSEISEGLQIYERSSSWIFSKWWYLVSWLSIVNS